MVGGGGGGGSKLRNPQRKGIYTFWKNTIDVINYNYCTVTALSCKHAIVNEKP